MVPLKRIKDGISKTYLAFEKHVRPDDYTTGLDLGDDQNMYVGAGADVVRFTGSVDPQRLKLPPRKDSNDILRAIYLNIPGALTAQGCMRCCVMGRD